MQSVSEVIDRRTSGNLEYKFRKYKIEVAINAVYIRFLDSLAKQVRKNLRCFKKSVEIRSVTQIPSIVEVRTSGVVKNDRKSTSENSTFYYILK